LTAFIVVSIAVPVMRRKDADDAGSGGFRVPFGPYVVPVLSILSCLYIMKDLSRLTFTIFAIWMAAALFVYFVYGVRHSALDRSPES
jgi:APA family basic amino acid/polyamine antiporter